MTRDFVGYGQETPDPKWPGGAQLALSFVINYEEGAENCILNGDATSEGFLADIPGITPSYTRDLAVESVYEYGSRQGFWRLHRLFTKRDMPVTVYACALALEQNPSACDAMVKANWEIASHGYRYIDYSSCPEETEREHIRKAIEIQTRLTGKRPQGFYQGRVSENTRRLVVEEGGFLYDSDSYCDELPFWNTDYGRPHLVIPYTLDNNDCRFSVYQGFNSGEHFFTYLKDAFDMLYDEGETSPKMMSVGLHGRLVGRPGRARALERFLDYVKQKPRVWVCCRADIARHWQNHHQYTT